MPTLHDLLTASVEADAQALAGESAPRAVRARIGAIRTRRAVIAGGGATLAVGAAALATVSDAGRTALKPATVGIGPTTITVPLSEASLAEDSPYPACGEPAPAPALTASGFTLDPGVHDTSGLRIAPVLTYTGDPFENAYMSPPEALVLHDGVIVASFGSGVDYPQEVDLAAGYVREAPDFLVGKNSSMFSLCSEATFDDRVALVAGDYEVVVVQAVSWSPVRIAIRDLERRGYPIAPSGVGSWVPGSIDCDKAVQDDINGYSSGVPVQCEPFGVEGVTVDEITGTITLPVSPHVGEDELEVLLASEPIPWTLDKDLTFSDLGVTMQEDEGGIPSTDDLTCGAQESSWWGYPLLGTTEASFDNLIATGGEIALDTQMTSQAQRADISLETTADAWVLWRRGGTVRVAAHATATLGDSDLSIDRAVDYARTTVTLDDIEWCDDPFLTGTDYRTEGQARRIVIVTPSTITGANGEVSHGEVIVVELPLQP